MTGEYIMSDREERKGKERKGKERKGKGAGRRKRNSLTSRLVAVEGISSIDVTLAIRRTLPGAFWKGGGGGGAAGRGEVSYFFATCTRDRFLER